MHNRSFPLGAPGDDPRSADLVVHYQPVVDLVRQEVVAVEAFSNGERRTPELALRVLEAAVRQGAGWAAQGLDLEVLVSVSTEQLTQPGLVGHLRGQLAASGLRPDRLLLGTSEQSLDETSPLLQELAALDLRIALDDFGTGYSSLHQLRRLPVHVLRIDPSFVLGLGSNRDDEATVSSVASMAASLGIRCMAPSVASEGQYARLAAVGCQVQGPLLSPAVPAAGLPAAVDRAEAFLELPRPTGSRTRPGQPTVMLREQVAEQMVRMHRDGASLETIAASLNQAGAVHPLGIRWHSRFVSRCLYDGGGNRQPMVASA